MIENQTDDEIDLTNLFKALIAKLWLIVLVAIAFAVLSFFVTKFLIAPKYQATSKLYVFNKSDVNTTGAVSSSDISTSKILVNTYIVVLQSDSVLGQVVDTIAEYQGKEGFEFLGTEPYTTKQIREMVSSGAINNTESFYVTVTAHDPYEAKFINDAILYYLPDEIIRVVKAGAVEIIDKASVPETKSSLSIVKNTLIGGVLGGVLISAVVVVMALLDTVIHEEEDLENEFPEIPVIGIIPDVKENGNKKPGQSAPKEVPAHSVKKPSPGKSVFNDDDDYEDEE